MKRYKKELIEEAKKLRMQGKTYKEINTILKTEIPKSTLREWFRHVPLPLDYQEKIKNFLGYHLKNVRKKALETNRLKREKYLREIDELNFQTAKKISDIDTAKIALSMLCLGEASKSGGGSSFYLGSSDTKIITLFIKLLDYCYKIDKAKLRCTVQCRADQDIIKLEEYWQAVTNIPTHQFYKTRVDKRSLGKPTQDINYRGVLRVDYFNNNVRLELESLADLVYNIVANQS